MKTFPLGNHFERLRQRWGAAGLIAFTLLLIILTGWTIHIFSAWLANPDLSHGLFTPVLFGLLLWESRQRGPFNYLPDRPALMTGALGTILLVSLVVLAAGSLYAAATDWGHPLAKFLVGSSLTGLLLATWAYAASNSVRLVPFNWISGVAIGLWFLSLPVPPGTYSELTLALQFRVTASVLAALHVLGIPAIQNGNIIDLAHASVGVEEACSGVRSLLSCIYAGFFFSAAFVRTRSSRVVLIVLAPVLAVLMNFVRSLTLTLLANAEIDIAGMWHDTTGYAILILTALMLAFVAWLLERLESSASPPTAAPTPVRPPSPNAHSTRLARIIGAGGALALLWIVALETLTRPAPHAEIVAPDLAEWLPDKFAGWSVPPPEDLYRFSDVLETRELAQRSYAKIDAQGRKTIVTLYLAYWLPGQTSVSVVASHTPDACWPGAGWEPKPTAVTSVTLPLAHRRTSSAEYRIFTYNDTPRHVWFWHAYDRQVLDELDPRRPLELISSVIRYGVRSDGDQLFVRLSSNRPWDEIGDDPLFTTLFEHLREFGI